MKNFCRVVGVTLLLSTPWLAKAVSNPMLTPEQTFDLYAQALLEDDASAARKLNDALKPAFDGADALTPTPRLFATLLAKPLQQELAKHGDAQSEIALVDMYSASLKGTQCRARHSEVQPDEYLEGQRIAKVDFTCQLTDLSSVRPLFEAGLRENTSTNLKKFIDAYGAALSDGARREVSGSITLRTANSKGYWHSVDFDGLLDPVFGAIAPFDEWSQDAAAAKAPKVTGVPSCDLLLQQHRHCVTSGAPEQLPGVDAMAEELKAKAKVVSPEVLTQECKALRPLAEAMWKDGCQ